MERERESDPDLFVSGRRPTLFAIRACNSVVLHMLPVHRLGTTSTVLYSVVPYRTCTVPSAGRLACIPIHAADTHSGTHEQNWVCAHHAFSHLIHTLMMACGNLQS